MGPAPQTGVLPWVLSNRSSSMGSTEGADPDDSLVFPERVVGRRGGAGFQGEFPLATQLTSG